MNTHKQIAYHAARAAQNLTKWGTFAAARYCQRRGISPHLLILAIRLKGGAA
jgi:hypothetical protein